MAKSMAISAKELGKAFFRREISLLVGSGASCACGLCSWDRLVNDMKDKLRASCPKAERAELNRFFDTNGPMEVAGLFKRKFGPVEYARFLRERLRNQAWTVAPILKSIVRLPVRIIFTTNFDKLIETAYRVKNREDPVVVTKPHQLSSLNGDETRIVKIHGDIDYPDTIVLTD